MGSGHQFRSQGTCQGMELQLPELLVRHKLFLFPLDGAEVVLGLEFGLVGNLGRYLGLF